MPLSQIEKNQIRDLLDREPTTVELQIFDAMWSEHCSYKSSKRILKKLPTKGSEVVLGIGEDSGIIHFTEFNGKRYGIVISHESHNHPSQILPIEGAATGVGGVVRDVYCMGADVIGVLNSLHFGADEEIAEEVVIGVSDYANPLGVPVLGGETLYHPSYTENCLVNVAAIGIIEEDKIIHSYVPKEAENEPYDFILIGKSTDATGFGGASFSSATLDTEQSNIGAVQVHDPFLKRVLVEAIKHLLKTVHEDGVSIGFKDLGAGGIACVTSELAAAGGFGAEIDLDKVNLGVENLPPEVIVCSETQERFCLVVPRSYSPKVLKIFNELYELPSIYHNAGAVVIGHVSQNPVYNVSHGGNSVCSLPIKAITTEVRANRQSKPRAPKTESTQVTLDLQKIKSICIKLLSLPNNCSKRYVYRFFDNAVRGDAIIYPGESDAVVTAPIEGCRTALAVSIDSNLYGHADPYISGAYAVAEAVRNVVSLGARPIAITDCLNYGNPEKPEVFFDFEEGVRGISDAANAFGFIEGEPLPVISGNVSFYNESKQGSSVIPSPVLLVAGKIDDYHKTVTMQVRQPGEKIILLGMRYAEFGGTQLGEVLDQTFSVAPQVRYVEEDRLNKAVFELIGKQLVSACHDISAGGLWVALTEMLLGERAQHRVGAAISIPTDISIETFLFSENGGFIISVSDWPKAKEVLKKHDADFWEIGETNTSSTVSIGTDIQIELADIRNAWNNRNQ